jgi:hypothetical protein
MLLFLTKRVVCLFFFICIFHCLNFAQSRYSNDPSVRRDPTGYKLRSGDNLVVYVQGEIETKIDAVIDGDGFIKPVYLNEIKISGLSTSENIPKEWFTCRDQLTRMGLTLFHLKLRQ